MDTKPADITPYTLSDDAVSAIADLAILASEPTEITPGIWAATGPDGVVHHLDLRKTLEEGRDVPDRVRAQRIVTDVASFVGYLSKHGLPETELWASPTSSTIKAVIDAPSTMAAWENHTVTLKLVQTPDWQHWVAHDGKLHAQLDFAEFIEDHLPNFAAPTAAEMLELAQTFQATTKVDFASSQRVKSGQTQINYVEDTTAKAGAKGQLAIPDTFTLGLIPYEGGDAYKVTARFRYRLDGSTLRLGYRLDRPADVLRAAFGEVIAQVQADTERTVWMTA